MCSAMGRASRCMSILIRFVASHNSTSVFGSDMLGGDDVVVRWPARIRRTGSAQSAPSPPQVRARSTRCRQTTSLERWALVDHRLGEGLHGRSFSVELFRCSARCERANGALRRARVARATPGRRPILAATGSKRDVGLCETEETFGPWPRSRGSPHTHTHARARCRSTILLCAPMPKASRERERSRVERAWGGAHRQRRMRAEKAVATCAPPPPPYGRSLLLLAGHVVCFRNFSAATVRRRCWVGFRSVLQASSPSFKVVLTTLRCSGGVPAPCPQRRRSSGQLASGPQVKALQS